MITKVNFSARNIFGSFDVSEAIEKIKTSEAVTNLTLYCDTTNVLLAKFPKYCRAKVTKVHSIKDGEFIIKNAVDFYFEGANPNADKRLKKIISVLEDIAGA